MDQLRRWMAKNRLLAKILLGAVLCGAYTWLFYLWHVPVWIIVPLDLFLLFWNHAYVDAQGDKLLKQPMKILDDYCDPYPFLQEVQVQMGYSYTKAAKQAIQINYALALRSVGQIQQAWEHLDSIHIDRYPGLLQHVKVVYYNNLTDILTQLGRYEEAEIWGRKAIQIYQDLPENEMKQRLHLLVLELQAESCFRKGEYAKAVEALDALPAACLREQVDRALLYAQCCIALGQTESAKEKLRFAAEKGYKLYAAAQARQLLEQIGD